MSSVVGAVTDGASNMKAAVKNHLQLKWFYCVPHMLNRAIQVALEETKLKEMVIKPAKQITRYLRNSNKAYLEVLSVVNKIKNAHI